MRRLFLLAVVLTAACSKSSGSPPTAPSVLTPALADVTGVWDLEYSVESCASPRPWYCPQIGSRRNVVLRLLQSGSTIDGVAFDQGAGVPVTGQVDPSGDIALTGSVPSLDPDSYDREIRIAQLTVARGVMSGRLDVISGGLTPVRILGQIVAQRSRRSLEHGFEGEWSGSFVVKACSGHVARCYPVRQGGRETFSLQLRQSGSEVTGTFRLGTDDFEVSGAVDGNELRVSGRFERTSGPYIIRVVIVRWLALRDDVGRLTGTFAYEHEDISPVGRTASTVEAEIWYVALKP